VNLKGHRRARRGVAVIVVLGLALAACSSDSDNSSGTTNTTASDADAGPPQRGGSVIYALEANTNVGWCLAEAQLAIAGIQVARAVYDTLTAPGADGKIHPFLAESVTSNADATVWTIKLRDGVKFHDNTDLTATVVKNNIDAYRGAYPGRSPLLFSFVFGSYIKSTEVVDPLTVRVTTNQPWPAFPWYLWGSARIGIMGQAQLDDAEHCDTNMIGTGPFKKKSFEQGPSGKFVAEANRNYWRMAPDGQPYPYLDEITFQAQESGPDRLTALKSGDYNMIHTSGALQIVDIREDSNLRYWESDKFAEVGYIMLNATSEPFNNIHARKAVAHAINRDVINEQRNAGILTHASGPFAPGAVGYVEDTGLPSFDPAAAQQEKDAYQQDTGKELTFAFTVSSDAETLKTAELVQAMLRDQGINTTLETIGDQSQYINEAIGKSFQAIFWRNHPGADPDTQYVWWHCNNEPPAACDNPVNFSGFNDPEINENLDMGRTTLDEAERAQYYEAVNRRFAEQVWELWAEWTLWSIAFQPSIHGVEGPELPDGTAPFEGLATGHPVEAMWMSK
jgi:peptide/nickel transport system substrate-binding protein